MKKHKQNYNHLGETLWANLTAVPMAWNIKYAISHSLRGELWEESVSLRALLFTRIE